jgi:hypothetical protein
VTRRRSTRISESHDTWCWQRRVKLHSAVECKFAQRCARKLPGVHAFWTPGSCLSREVIQLLGLTECLTDDNTCSSVRPLHVASTSVAKGEHPPYCTVFIISKIGRYIATTMPPTTTPRNTIINGSSKDSNPLTAVSTSSS